MFYYINEITFYGKRNFGKILMWGAITGAGVWVVLTALILASDAHGEEAIGKFMEQFIQYQHLPYSEHFRRHCGSFNFRERGIRFYKIPCQ